MSMIKKALKLLDGTIGKVKSSVTFGYDLFKSGCQRKPGKMLKMSTEGG